MLLQPDERIPRRANVESSLFHAPNDINLHIFCKWPPLARGRPSAKGLMADALAKLSYAPITKLLVGSILTSPLGVFKQFHAGKKPVL